MSIPRCRYDGCTKRSVDENNIGHHIARVHLKIPPKPLVRAHSKYLWGILTVHQGESNEIESNAKIFRGRGIIEEQYAICLKQIASKPKDRSLVKVWAFLTTLIFIKSNLLLNYLPAPQGCLDAYSMTNQGITLTEMLMNSYGSVSTLTQ